MDLSPKGFGFISEEGAGKEHFVHISGLIDEIREGDEVEFELEQGKRGLRSLHVEGDYGATLFA